MKVVLRPLVSEAMAGLYPGQILNEIELARTPKEQGWSMIRAPRGTAYLASPG
jgi:hypothetical protein